MVSFLLYIIDMLHIIAYHIKKLNACFHGKYGLLHIISYYNYYQCLCIILDNI